MIDMSRRLQTCGLFVTVSLKPPNAKESCSADFNSTLLSLLSRNL